MEKNMFVKIAKNLLMSRNPKINVRHDLKLRDTRACMEEVVGHKLKNNKSYFSLLIKGCEVFLGEVNYDLSSIPIGDFYKFEECFTNRITEELRRFIKMCDKDLVVKLQDHIKDGNYRLRYIVKDDTAGKCLSFVCELEWRNKDPLFRMRTVCCDRAYFGLEWLDYWYDRKDYFTD